VLGALFAHSGDVLGSRLHLAEVVDVDPQARSAVRVRAADADVAECLGLVRLAQPELLEREHRSLEAIAESRGELGEERGLPLLSGSRHDATKNARPRRNRQPIPPRFV
jgi:hypothetical protein